MKKRLDSDMKIDIWFKVKSKFIIIVFIAQACLPVIVSPFSSPIYKTVPDLLPR